MTQNILTEIDHGVGILTLNRADRHNAFDDLTVTEIADAMEAFSRDDAVRAIVISSTGKSFCAGADLNWMKRMAGYSTDDNLQDSLAMAQMFCRIAQCPKPVLARVQGPAYGGGVGLVAACDIAVGTFDAQFALTEARLGLIPAVISPHVVAAIGERYARRYFLTAERFSAAEAYRMGLLHEMVADESGLDEAIGELLTPLLQNGPHAMRECKELIRAVSGKALTQEVLDDTALRITRRRASPEGREGMSAFLEKRKPNWITGA
jgi:methylglutaconyl-CoA hydratase